VPLNPDQARSLARKIASGHAWAEHRSEFALVSDATAFASIIESILATPDAERMLTRGRAAY
jgi:hypothetical protein